MSKKNQAADAPVVVARYSDDFMANIGLTKLHEAGIPAMLNNETAATVFGMQLPYNTIRLLVFPKDIETARELLRDTGGLLPED
ncbi:MAG: DUF2007 domain-containing protein [Bacteroidales bacterium]|nr:DUF2007 domain-containing protein [Bacteroidales bacterium]MDY2916317.1 DUF2007 domain-containing protein [Muribaculaceae bacterium]